jgi:hypothetical protein
MNIKAFWNDIITQNREALPSYFCDRATVRWHCTNEQFTVSEYIKANCDYPGDWTGEIERIVDSGSTIVLAGQVLSSDRKTSCHVVSFIKLDNGLISEMDEYWADDGEAPSWRKELGISKPIQ